MTLPCVPDIPAIRHSTIGLLTISSATYPYNQKGQSLLTVPSRVVPDPARLNDPDALKYETFPT